MAQVNKIDSNSTGLAYSEESALGVNGSPNWKALEPNSYSDFGGELVTVAPNPINSSRQRRKGVATDLNAAGGFNHNLTFHNLMDLMQGVFFANLRKKTSVLVTAVDPDSGNPDEYECASTSGFSQGNIIKGFNFANSANNAVNIVTAITANVSVEVATGLLVAEASPPADAFIKIVGHRAAAGDIDVTVTGDYATYTSTSLDFGGFGIVPGQWIFVGGDGASLGFTTAANNGFKRVRSVSAHALVVDKSVLAMSSESSTTETIEIYFGDVLKNELDTDIVRRSYHIERLLGAPVVGNAAKQSEVLIGAVPNEFTLNIPTAELVNADFTFIAIDHQLNKATSEGGSGPQQTSVDQPLSADVYNTSSDFSRIKMSIHSTTSEAPTPLFAFITEATITINNNVSPNKAVSVLGAFDVTAGNFQVGGSISAYFASVAAVSAVRENEDVTLDMILTKDNTSMVLDLPLIALGDGRLTVEQDQPIKLPLNMDAATARDIDPNLDYTAMFTFFFYTPDAAA